MLCVIPFFSGDKDQAIRLAQWIRDLGGVKNHNCLLVVDESTTAEGVYEPLVEAFRSVSVTSSKPTGAQGTWGNGTTDATAANEMWLTAATYVYHKLKVPFFWMEPDAAPTRSIWLDEIESEYKSAKKHFMGMCVDMPPHEIHMSGIGCYPYDVANHSLAMMMPGRTAWDYAGRKDTVEKGKAHFTKLIQHVYRINGNVPEWPTFPTLDSLSQIAPETAVFHRCKDGTLIERLRSKRNVGFDPAFPGQDRTVIMEVSIDRANPSETALWASVPAKSVDGVVGTALTAPPFETVEFKYTLRDLQELRECMKCNNGVLSSSLSVFMHGRGLYIIPWLEMAEKIQDDPQFPENHFQQKWGDSPDAKPTRRNVPLASTVSAAPTSNPAARRKQRMKTRKKAKRTPEKQAAINTRMANARAARKPKLTGVV